MNEIIRPAVPEDSEAILSVYEPFVTGTVISFEIDVPGIDEFRHRMCGIIERYSAFVCECDDKVIGYAYASRHRERAAYRYSVDISIYIMPQYHGRGIGKKLYTRLFESLCKMGYYTAYAGIAIPNDKSLALHKSMGFTEVGIYKNVGYKLGKWHDVMWLCKPLRSYDENPAEPENNGG